MDTLGNSKRTIYCGDLREEHIGSEVTVCGWVQKSRNLGTLIFADIRDRSGICQLAFDESSDKEVFEKATKLRSEFVISAKGTVRKRESVNTEIPTGLVEVFVSELKILAKSETPPFEIKSETDVKDELRLKYRYLDLRREPMQKALLARHKITKATRDYFDNNGFIEIETPTLIKSTPEGARDYLVPSRVHKGEFYALPQSPQLYKQLIMLSGYDRYMQIARCYRDEDLRADRQPEFTQIDMEMSFSDENDIMAIGEGFLKHVFKTVLDKDIVTPFKRITWNEAMERYGSDKPDTRFGLELKDLSSALKDTEFKVFRGAIDGGGSVRGINVKGGAELSRKEIDKLTEFVKDYKAKGLAYTKLASDKETSSYEKFLSESEVKAVREVLGAETGDLLLIVADSENSTVFASLGALRNHLAEKLGLIEKGTFDFLWVTEFPLFEYDKDEERYVAMHHPFTSPFLEDRDKLLTEPGKVRARAYDVVLNGYELGGGSIRISDPELQSEMFTALGFTKEEAYEKFGFLLDAFKYGVPPHGGMAIGLDRLVMLMTEKTNIRDVIAFPKVQNATELMTMCPSPVPDKNLLELGIAKISEEEK